jgi:hypothetical protein
MQLNIYELNENDAEDTENNELIEEIPENTISIKKNMPQSILKKNVNKPKISYEDILSKMGMFVSDGKLHLVDKNSVSFKNNAEGTENKVITNIPQNSYIHNKYFKNELQKIAPSPPKTLQEYKKRVLENYIERLRINQIKSKKLLMPTSNISMATGNSSNLNKFFKFK